MKQVKSKLMNLQHPVVVNLYKYQTMSDIDYQLRYELYKVMFNVEDGLAEILDESTL